IMQAFAAVRPQEGAMRAFVVPGLVAVTGFHRRDDMHQAGIVATHGKNLGDEVLLADMALGNMFDGHASSTGQFASPVADAIAERFSKSRIVEDADLPRRQKCRHSLRITGPWQRAGDDDAVVAGEHPGEALTVTIRQQLPQASLRLPRLLRLSYPVWFRLGRLRNCSFCLGGSSVKHRIRETALCEHITTPVFRQVLGRVFFSTPVPLVSPSHGVGDNYRPNPSRG